jgi:peroxiredoxin
MKYIIHLFLASSLLVVACSNKPVGNSRVNLKIENSANKKVVLQHLTNSAVNAIDSAQINANGEMSFGLELTEIGFYRLYFDKNSFIVFILSPNDKITIEGKFPNLMQTTVIKGSIDNELLRIGSLLMQSNYQKSDSLQKVFQANQNNPNGQEMLAGLTEQYESLMKLENDFIKGLIDKYPDSFFNLAFIEKLDKEKDIEYYSKLDKGLQKKYPSSDYVKSFHSNVQELMKLMPGSPAPEIDLPGVDGKNIKLSSLKGKVVLIDFWASWCKPCRMENPNVVKMYNRFKDKNFTVFSVSLDKQKENWLEAISKDNLTWPNHCSDLAFWSSAVVPLYNIQGIPLTVLIDKEGKIIAKNLRGQELEQKLESILAK